MGRPRGGKAKRPTSQATKNEDGDAGSGDEEAVIPAYKRRGRPQKHLEADDTDEEDSASKVEPTEDSDGAKPVVPAKGSAENGRKKKRRRQPKRVLESVTEEKDEPPTQSGFRHLGSRRKSTPRRAAEAGVECK